MNQEFQIFSHAAPAVIINFTALLRHNYNETSSNFIKEHCTQLCFANYTFRVAHTVVVYLATIEDCCVPEDNHVLLAFRWGRLGKAVFCDLLQRDAEKNWGRGGTHLEPLMN